VSLPSTPDEDRHDEAEPSPSQKAIPSSGPGSPSSSSEEDRPGSSASYFSSPEVGHSAATGRRRSMPRTCKHNKVYLDGHESPE
jgi:hypothetical protein